MFAAFRHVKLLFLLLALLAVGIVCVQEGYRKGTTHADHRRRFRSPITISCRDFVRTHPREGWYRITDCHTDASSGVFSYWAPRRRDDQEEKKSSPFHAVIPARMDNDLEAPGQIAVLTQDQNVLDVLHDMQALGMTRRIPSRYDEDQNPGWGTTNDTESKSARPTEAKVAAWAQENQDRLFETRTIEGMVVSPDDVYSEDRQLVDHMAQGNKGLVPGYLIFQEGAAPPGEDTGGLERGLGLVLLTIFAGIVFVPILFVIARNRREAREWEEWTRMRAENEARNAER